MTFDVGDTVVHPHHGTATIEDTEERRFDGETVQYLVLRTVDDNLTLKVPADICEEVGIRDVIGEDAVDEVMRLLRQESPKSKKSWQRRRARNEKRLRSGDPEELAAVVRELSAREQRRGRLSPSELQQLASARELLRDEIVAATGEDEDLVDGLIDDALAEGGPREEELAGTS